jgi:hypothetical protein
MPALMLYPRDATFAHEAQQALSVGDVPGGIAGLMDAYLNDLGITEEDIKGILYLNASSTLVQHVAAEGQATEAESLILTVIYQCARLFAGRTLTPSDVASAYHEIGVALASLLPSG